MTFASSAALMDNAWSELEKRGVRVTAEREPGWRWWRQGPDPMQARIQGRILYARHPYNTTKRSQWQWVAPLPRQHVAAANQAGHCS